MAVKLVAGRGYAQPALRRWPSVCYCESMLCSSLLVRVCGYAQARP